ncbi:MAG: NAD-dependent epimerase/dehydratase family protein [Anaerolineae bacterium]|nr:NAD-dependent epimerase/dehydratase family protein [Anaerolineae bacterium]
MKRILVTGGLGFIGSHLTEALLSQGHEVHIVDDMRADTMRQLRLFDEWRLSGVPIHKLAFSPCKVVEFNPPAPQFDQIYHLASPVGPAGVLKQAGMIAGQIVADIYHLMALAQTCKAKLLFVSTSEVYGGGQQGLCREDMPCIIQANTTARLEYALGKLAAECALRNSGQKAVIIRPFNVAGPRQSPKGGFVLPRFIEQARSNIPLTVFESGEQIRAFTHVRDIVNGLILAMDKGGAGQVYNLGNPLNRTTILQLAKTVQRVVNPDAPISHTDGKAIYGATYAEAADKYPDATKAMQELDWQPTLLIEDIVRDTLAEYQRRDDLPAKTVMEVSIEMNPEGSVKATA